MTRSTKSRSPEFPPQSPVVERIAAGPVALELHWDGETLLGCAVAPAAEADAPTAPGRLTPGGRALAAALARYVAGDPDPWPAPALDWRGVTPFARRVLETLARTVPSGRTTTYGELARAAGSPDAARAVGRVMAANRWPVLIPCHRVLTADGGLGGYSGRGGAALKKVLLDIENRTQTV